MLAALLAVGLNALVAPPDRKLTQGDIRPPVVLFRRLGEDRKWKAAGKGGADAGSRGGAGGPGGAEGPGAVDGPGEADGPGDAGKFSLTGVVARLPISMTGSPSRP